MKQLSLISSGHSDNNLYMVDCLFVKYLLQLLTDYYISVHMKCDILHKSRYFLIGHKSESLLF